VHKKFGSPNKIILIEWVVIVAMTLVGGLIFGPFEGAAIITAVNGVALYIVHILANFSLPIYGKKTLKLKMKGLLPLALGPVLATVVYGFAIYGEFVPIPAFPGNVAPYSIIAVVLVGIALTVVLIYKKHASDMDIIGTEQDHIKEEPIGEK